MSLAVVHLVATLGGVVFAAALGAGLCPLVGAVRLVARTHIVLSTVVDLASTLGGVILATLVGTGPGSLDGATTSTRLSHFC